MNLFKVLLFVVIFISLIQSAKASNYTLEISTASLSGGISSDDRFRTADLSMSAHFGFFDTQHIEQNLAFTFTHTR